MSSAGFITLVMFIVGDGLPSQAQAQAVMSFTPLSFLTLQMLSKLPPVKRKPFVLSRGMEQLFVGDSF